MDSSGLHAILTCSALCLEDGCELSLIPGPEHVQRVFEITAVTERLPFR